MPSQRIVTRLPAECLTDDERIVKARRERWLSKSELRELLRCSPVEFIVADVGTPFQRIDIGKCYEFWKSEAEPHLVDEPDSEFYLEDFPGEYAYLASVWCGENQTPIVLLEKHH